MTDDPRVRLIPVDRIRVVNPRARDKKKFEEIVESIKAVGLKKPITVASATPGDDGGQTFDLVCGQGRLEAFVALGQKEIPALVRGFSQPDGLLASLIENIARRRVRSLDQVKLIQWMKDQGHDYADIARKTGLSEVYVRQILTMLEKGEERLLEGVLHGEIPVS
ncbi:MAG: ParB N-terminal domain-containing protein, partial [Phycisphaerales bacterium]|nr:ParB N-terminal domain-containing protein [Phycisphaerales bacterium]